jgi:hypothetical protein
MCVSPQLHDIHSSGHVILVIGGVLFVGAGG